jgi:hypothetical protein
MSLHALKLIALFNNPSVESLDFTEELSQLSVDKETIGG